MLPSECAHKLLIKTLKCLDNHPRLCRRAASLFPTETLPVSVGRVRLDSPLVLAAGLVKGDGFTTEAEAMDAVGRGCNIIGGWRSLPAFVGAVEMGSFTPLPRLGNRGRVHWRDQAAESLYNRVGLRNPGARAAARFLSERAYDLPPVYGISVAADPLDEDLGERCEKLAGAAEQFIGARLRPSWMTLNLSCPNTAAALADSAAEETAAQMCTALKRALPAEVPLWVKLRPELPESKYVSLVDALADSGVEAIVAVNTLKRNVPKTGISAGLSGRPLTEEALRVLGALRPACERRDLALVGCGGVMDGESLAEFIETGASAVQYWSALVFRGPFAPAWIVREARSMLPE